MKFWVLIFLLSANVVRAADQQTIESLGLEKFYGKTFVLSTTEQGCITNSAYYHHSPVVGSLEVLTKDEAEKEIEKRHKPIMGFSFVARVNLVTMDSCEKMNPIGNYIFRESSDPNYNLEILANDVEVVNDEISSVDLRLSFPCGLGSEYNVASYYCFRNGETFTTNWIIRVPKNSGKLSFSTDGFELLRVVGGSGRAFLLPSKYPLKMERAVAYIPIEKLPGMASKQREALSNCGLLMNDAEKTRAEATSQYEKLFSAGLNGGLKLRGPDGHGLRNVATPYEERVNQHVKLMKAESTCSPKEIQQYEKAMNILIEQLHNLEVMSQGLWG